MLTPIPPTFTPLTPNRFNRSSNRLLAAGAALGLLLTACGDDTNNAEAVNAAAELDPAGEATEPIAEPTVEETPGLQTGSDGALEFNVWQHECTWAASDNAGNPIKGMGRGCSVRATVTNNGSEPVKMRAVLQEMADADGESYGSHQEGQWFLRPIEPGETRKSFVGWFPLPEVEMLQITFRATEGSEGATFDFTDPFFTE